MKISRELALKILKYLNENANFNFPFMIMCHEYLDGDGELMEVESFEWEMVMCNDKYQTFELWENLQNLDEETMELMTKGFLEKIINI